MALTSEQYYIHRRESKRLTSVKRVGSTVNSSRCLLCSEEEIPSQRQVLLEYLSYSEGGAGGQPSDIQALYIMSPDNR